MVRKIISIILVISIASNAFAYVPTIKGNVSKYANSFESNDITAELEQVAQQQVQDVFGELDEDSQKALASMFGADAESLKNMGSTTSGTSSKYVPLLGQIGVVCPILTHSVLDDDKTAQWHYSENMYKVRTENFKGFTNSYPFACMMTDREYKMFYRFCQIYKWDYLLLLSKWNYQSAHQFLLERTKSNLNSGLAGQIVTEDGGVTYLDKLFTSEELTKTGTKSRLNKIHNTGGTETNPGPTAKGTFVAVGDIVPKATAIGFSKKAAERWKWLATVTDDERLERMKMNLIFLKEARLVLSSITKGKIRDYSKKDYTKLREILEKEVWSDEDYSYCFDDLVEEDVFYKEYDSAPVWKQQAYLLLKHWSLGSSDSGTSHLMVGAISNYVKNKEFDITRAKAFIFQAIAGDVVCNSRKGNNGENLLKDAYGVFFNNPAIYGGKGGQYSKNIVGVDLAKLDSLFEKNSVPEYFDIFNEDFEQEINKGTLMKGILFALSGFMFSSFKLEDLSLHGSAHAGLGAHTKYLNSMDLGCPTYITEVNGEKVAAGGSYIVYNRAIDYWYGSGTW